MAANSSPVFTVSIAAGFSGKRGRIGIGWPQGLLVVDEAGVNVDVGPRFLRRPLRFFLPPEHRTGGALWTAAWDELAAVTLRRMTFLLSTERLGGCAVRFLWRSDRDIMRSRLIAHDIDIHEVASSTEWLRAVKAAGLDIAPAAAALRDMGQSGGTP